MSKYHYGPYSSLTPRLQSSLPTSDLNSAHTLTNPIKSHQRSETLSPEGPKKSPPKTAKTSKSQLESQLKGALTSKNTKKSSASKTTKGKTKKSNSPSKDPLTSNGETKKRTSKPQIMTNNYELDNITKHKSSSVKSLSIPQSMFNQPGYEANFANWLNEKIRSPKNANVNSVGVPVAHSAELVMPAHTDDKGQGSNGDPHNVWPESKKSHKNESQSHRQSIESPNAANNAKKSLQNQLSAFAGHNEAQKPGSASLAEGEKNVKSISKQKSSTHKLSLGSKEQFEAAKKLTLKVSPRALDPYIGLPHPLSTQSQSNTQPKMNSLDAHSLGSSYNFEFQRDVKRVSLEPNQNSYSHDPQFDFPKSAKNQTRPKGNFFKDSPATSKKDESSARAKEMSPGTGNEEAKVPARLKSAKHSDPNIYNDLNNYMHMMMNGKGKRASDSQIQAQLEGESHVLSTRSALDRYENRLGAKVKQGESSNVAQDSSGKSKGKEKSGSSNGNGKFTSLKNQMQEKRSKTNVKSADWSIPSQNSQKQASGQEETPGKDGEDKEEPSKAQLYQILQRTEQVLMNYKHRENKWGKEKKELVAEVKYLRSIIEKLK